MKYLLSLFFFVWLFFVAIIAALIDTASYVLRRLSVLLLFAAYGATAQSADTLNVLQYTGSVDTLTGTMMVMGQMLSRNPDKYNVYLIEGYALEWKEAPMANRVQYYTRRHRKIPRERVLSFTVNKTLLNQD